MDNLLIAWLLLTPMVFLFGAALTFDVKKRDYGSTTFISTVLFVFPLWAVYFLLKAVL